MQWLTGQWSQVGEVVAKAVLMYAVALAGLRLGERRTLAQWTIIDFITSVAVGAVVGRTAIVGTQSFTTGAAALLALIAVHRLASLLRFNRQLVRLFDHRVRVLVAHGEVRRHQLRICGLTEEDLYAQLRQRGVFELAGIGYVLYEAKGMLTVVPESAGTVPGLVRAGLDASADYDTVPATTLPPSGEAQ